ncbi:RICIN domain-containing protein [Streptoalloteichus hindustanus]|uniref:Ricin-type beta-trefoil lectin domain-containing protein n=1 Tax=Streptoalloteichus hindustanus TaxID=2017 RepID=A0A1M5F7M4_STRHI|nr:ricin-type beta-trefoil lectin domain protein [Streptoalloteichus hindustanus]SHF87536.1 Ricin-type beta-trefoil lectin domain-containing protein [Streptoalloteichus hindustanus]
MLGHARTTAVLASALVAGALLSGSTATAEPRTATTTNTTSATAVKLIRNAGNGFCLDIKTYNVGEPVILWPCHGGTSQQWRT